MQFKNPNLLFSLFLLLIPIIVHFFQLRKFKKTPFTNVAFLTKVKTQNRKSAQLKKWLILLSRLSFLACLIIAFAQPYFSKNNSNFNTKEETVIYLDNSFSLQAKGKDGVLLKSAINELITYLNDTEKITLVTNNEVYRNRSITEIKNDLLDLKYSQNQLSYTNVLLKSEACFTKNKNSNKHLLFISDFQKNSEIFTSNKKTYKLHLVKLLPENTANTSIENVSIKEVTPNTTTIKVIAASNKPSDSPISIALYNNNKLVTKSSVTTKNKSTEFSIPNTEPFVGTLKVDDPNYTFDNQFYFNINKSKTVNVLSISDNLNTSGYLKQLFKDSDFKHINTTLKKLDYSEIANQNCIVINELINLPQSLITRLSQFSLNGGSIIVIPNKASNIASYNKLLNELKIAPLKKGIPGSKQVTTIHYDHPIYSNNVFEKRVKNFQYPKVSYYYPSSIKNSLTLLSFENGDPFIKSKNNTFIFSAPINKTDSNFTELNLIVPTLYNMAVSSLKPNKLNYTIGNDNSISINTVIPKDDVLTITNTENTFIPLQKQSNKSVVLNLTNYPTIAGHYNVKHKEQQLETLSFNYNKKESIQEYYNILNFTNTSNSVANTINTIKSDSKINELWKWFVIFALGFVLIEILLLKFLK